VGDDPHSSENSAPYREFSCRPRAFHPGILTKLSSRWFRHWSTKVLPIPVPYIDMRGKFTIHRLGVWETYPETWFASVVATINSRLLSFYNRRSKKYIDRSTRNFIFRVATFYAFTHSNYALDRILANLRPGGLTVAKSLLRFFVSNLGETFRFVSNQANFNALWFSSRSKWIRDKPQLIEDILDRFPFCSKSGRRRKRRFLIANPFLSTLNWLRVNIDEYAFR